MRYSPKWPPDPGKNRSQERKKILVVDDDKIIVDTILQALEDDEHGYELMSAADGLQAELEISRFKPDLIILDIMIPDINGYEVCRKVKVIRRPRASKLSCFPPTSVKRHSYR